MRSFSLLRMTITGVIIFCFVSLSQADDPKSKQIVSGIAYGAGAIMTGKNAVVKSIECAHANYWACLEATGSYASAYVSTVKSDDSFDNADQLDTSGSVGRQNFTIPDDITTVTTTNLPNANVPTLQPNPVDVSTPGKFSCPGDDSDCNDAIQSLRTALGSELASSGVFLEDNAVDLGQLRQVVKEKSSFAQSQIEGLSAKGINLDDIKAHPEKYLTQDQVAELKANPEKYGLDSGNTSGDKANRAIAESKKDSKTDSSTFSFNFQNYDSDFGSRTMPDFNSLFGMAGMFDFTVQEGLKNSAPGYYGNVSLKSLDPRSKLSLFERVTAKIKRSM